jgi:hypothetical protein
LAEGEWGDLPWISIRRGGEQLVVGWPALVRRVVEAGDDGLERGDALAALAKCRAERRGNDGLADARVGAGDEQPADG